MRLSYVTRSFPRLTETFVLREVAEMRARGEQLEVWVLLGPDPGEHEPRGELVDAVRPLIRRVPRERWRLIAAVGWAAGRHPYRLLRATAWTMRWALHDRDAKQLGAIGFAAYLARHLQRGTHVHAHFANAPATVGLVTAWLAGTTFSFSGHGRDMTAATSPEFLAAKIRRATAVVCGTEDAAGQLRSLAGPGHAAKVTVVRNGVVPPQRAPTPPQDPPTVLSVARLVPKKGIDTLLAALAVLRKEGLAFEAEIVGDGPERPALETLAAALKLDGVRFLGALDRAELDAALGRASIFALPSRPLADGDADGLPVAILEALAHGVPVVSTRVAGIPEAVIDGETGLLVAPDDSRALANALRTLLTDAALRTRLGAGGRELALASYDPATNVERLATRLANDARWAP